MGGFGETILVFNAGSSSLKLGHFDVAAERQLAHVETLWLASTEPAADRYRETVRRLLTAIDIAPVVAVGHRVVHGGARYTAAVRIDAAVKRDIGELGRLAPLHNPAALAVIDAAEQLLPAIPQVAAFDTAFHQTMPPAAYLYPVPYHWYEAWGIRRFGFHGLSHAYCSGRAAELVSRPVGDLRTVVCHLGAGCSLAAIGGGHSVATSMGFTPLDGIPMATRPGALDPGILLHLLGAGRLDREAMEDALTHDAGLAGVSGISGDVRELLAARRAGHERACLALEIFTARVREGIGAMAVALGGLDILVFTGGIGEHAAELRAEVCHPLRWLGVELDAAANAVATEDSAIAAAGSPISILVIQTREDLMVARETRRVTGREPS